MTLKTFISISLALNLPFSSTISILQLSLPLSDFAIDTWFCAVKFVLLSSEISVNLNFSGGLINCKELF